MNVHFFLRILLFWGVTVVRMHVSFLAVRRRNDYWMWALLAKSVADHWAVQFHSDSISCASQTQRAPGWSEPFSRNVAWSHANSLNSIMQVANIKRDVLQYLASKCTFTLKKCFQNIYLFRISSIDSVKKLVSWNKPIPVALCFFLFLSKHL